MRRQLRSIDEVIHYWANQVELMGEYGKVSFEGKRLCSYGLEIAAFRKTPSHKFVVFIDDRDRNPSTSSHQSKAISGSKQHEQVIYNRKLPYSSVEEIEQTPSDICPTDIWKQYHRLFTQVLESTVIPKFSRTKDNRLLEAGHWAQEANDLAEFFCLDVPWLELELSPEQKAAIRKQAALAQKAEKQRLKVETKVEQEEWLAGTRRSYPKSQSLDIQLRISATNPEIVETSRGASIPKKVCERLWKAWQKQVMPEDCSVGRYHLDKVTSSGLTIGCHEIKAGEIQRFAKVLWGDDA